MTEPKYPAVHVTLTGRAGKAYALLGAVSAALKRAGISKAQRDAFLAEATAGDYDHLLQTAIRWVEVR